MATNITPWIQRVTGTITGLPAALGRLAAAASASVVLCTEDAAKVPALGQAAKAASVPVTEASDSLLLPPGSHTAITPSDSTNVTSIASIGLLCTVDGSLSYRGVTTSSTTVTQPVVAGQYVYGRFSRVMAATTATVIGLAP